MIEEFRHKECPFTWGTYTLLKYLYTSREGEVFIATDRATLKEFSSHSSIEDIVEELIILRRGLVPISSSGMLDLKLSEFNLFQQLNHPQICRLIEAGSLEDAPLIISQYTMGKRLVSLLAAYLRKKKTLEWTIAVYIAHQLCLVLEYLHQKTLADGSSWNLVYSRGGFFPANIFIGYSGDIQIVDIGLRHHLNDIDLLGKEHAFLEHRAIYLPPEAVTAEALDFRADIFCVGWLLWEMLTGEHLFAGSGDFKTLENIKTANVQKPSNWNPEIPAELDQVVLKALRRKPKDRYLHIGQMKGQLEKFVDLEQTKTILEQTMHSVFASHLKKVYQQLLDWKLYSSV